MRHETQCMHDIMNLKNKDFMNKKKNNKIYFLKMNILLIKKI